MKPIESRHVRAIASTSYPSNRICAHPECSEPVTLRPSGEPSVHHSFPASQIGGRSYFVEIEGVGIIPHAVGLCGSGTTGHHGDVEEHRAWIKYEEGVYNWYERDDSNSPGADPPYNPFGPGWNLLGPLNPQPGSTEGKPKRRKFRGEAKRNRATISIRVPKDDQEDGAAVYDSLMELAKEKLKAVMFLQYEPKDYQTLIAVLHDWVT